MKFLERDLENIIWDNIQTPEGGWELSSRGLTPAKFVNRSYRQLRIGNYGIADIVTAYRDGGGGLYVTVWELKRLSVDLDALIQVSKYVKGIKSYLSKRLSDELYFKVDAVLVGNSVDNRDDWVYLGGIINDVRLYAYDYQIDGIKFHQQSMNYALIEEGFNV